MSDNIKEIFSWVFTIIFAIVLALAIRSFIFQVVQVKQSSMSPTLIENEKLIASEITYTFRTPQRGEIVIIEINEETDYVKRVIGVGGDRIKIEFNTVYVNGEALREDYISDELEYPNYNEITVPDGEYFVLGDNRPNSRDSRDPNIGFIKEEDIKAHIVFRIYPFDRFGKVK